MVDYKGDVLLHSYVYVNPHNVVDYLSAGESCSYPLLVLYRSQQSAASAPETS
jgi:hypothetical protein